MQALDPVPLKASSREVEGVVEWNVGPAKEGQYFLAARFEDATGKVLVTRSEIVTIAPAYPDLLAAAEAAVSKAAAKKSTMSPLVREMSLPSVEMRVEEAKMRFYDFGRAPRDWDFVKQQPRGGAEPRPTGSRRARTRTRTGPGSSRRPTVRPSTIPSSPTPSTCRSRTIRPRPTRCW